MFPTSGSEKAPWTADGGAAPPAGVVEAAALFAGSGEDGLEDGFGVVVPCEAVFSFEGTDGGCAPPGGLLVPGEAAAPLFTVMVMLIVMFCSSGASGRFPNSEFPRLVAFRKESVPSGKTDMPPPIVAVGELSANIAVEDTARGPSPEGAGGWYAGPLWHFSAAHFA